MRPLSIAPINLTNTACSEVYAQNRPSFNIRGYTSAIDIWSIGIITAVLLTGDLIFVDTEDAQYTHRTPEETRAHLARLCDLSMLDAESQTQWSCVGKRAKAFVKSLLVLDEKDRPAAKQALQDPWFTNHACAHLFEELYEKAVKGWEKRPRKHEIVTEIDTSDIVPEATFHDEQGLSSSPTKSAYFGRPSQASPEIPETSPSPHPSQLYEGDHEDEHLPEYEHQTSRMQSFEFQWPSQQKRVGTGTSRQS